MNKFSLPDQYRKYYHNLEPIIQKPKTKLYSTIIFFFLVVALFGWYAIKPTIQTILYLRREIVDKQAINKKMDEKIDALVQAQTNLDTIQKHLVYLSDALPPNANAVDAARQLQTVTKTTIASLSALQIASVPILTESSGSAGTKTTESKYNDFPITLSLVGPYTDLSTILYGILGMRRIFRIDSMTFSQEKESVGAPSNNIQLTLKISGFYTPR